MKKNNEKGFLHIIVCILIFIIFAITLYACLDILDLIEVPKEYSISEWLSRHKKDVVIEIDNEGIAENIYKKVKIQVDPKEELNSGIASPEVNGYGGRENSSQNYNSPSFSYYNQLDDYAKTIYRELEKNLDNMKSGTYNVQFGTTFDDLLHQENGETVLNNSFQLAINALNFDNPELFYIDISKVYLLTKISTKLWITTYEVEIGASQGQSYLNPTFGSEQEIDQAIRMIENEKANIRNRLSGSIENQIKGVHDYLVDNLEYDSSVSRDNIYNIYGALVNKCTVCEGYARAFKDIMDDLKIPCLIACGTAVNSSGQTESHAWNYVQLDGRWYAIDVTWDDPIIVGNGFVSRSVNYKYYLKGSNEFFTNHTENGDIVGNANFKYPTLNPDNY